VASSSAYLVASIVNWPFFSNMNPTDPGVPRFPPLRDILCRMSATVRVGLSVIASMMSATPPGP
jgi:hypothetical protein